MMVGVLVNESANMCHVSKGKGDSRTNIGDVIAKVRFESNNAVYSIYVVHNDSGFSNAASNGAMYSMMVGVLVNESVNVCHVVKGDSPTKAGDVRAMIDITPHSSVLHPSDG